MRTQVLVHGNAHYCHASSRKVSDKRDQGQCRCCVGLVAVNDVHVCGHEDADIAEADKK